MENVMDPDPLDPDPDPDPQQCSKVRNNEALVKFTFEKFNKLAVFSNFLAFFLFSFEKFSFLDPDPDLHIECGSGFGSSW